MGYRRPARLMPPSTVIGSYLQGDVVMMHFKVVGISIVASTVLGATSCLAQMVSTFAGEPPIPVENTSLPLPHATQVVRCQDFGRYVNLVASARDAGESRQHLIGRLGLNMQGGEGMYQGRLPRNIRAAGGTALVQQIYATNASPATWQKQMLAVCERKIVS